jgi:hypothetical protein
MKSKAILQYMTTQTQLLYDLLSSEDYNFKPKEIEIEILKQENCVEVHIQAETPQLLKIATTAVNDSCEVIRKTKGCIDEYK